MKTYTAIWRIEFDVSEGDNPNQAHEDLLAQTYDMNASIFVAQQPREGEG